MNELASITAVSEIKKASDRSPLLVEQLPDSAVLSLEAPLPPQHCLSPPMANFTALCFLFPLPQGHRWSKIRHSPCQGSHYCAKRNWEVPRPFTLKRNEAFKEGIQRWGKNFENGPLCLDFIFNNPSPSPPIPPTAATYTRVHPAFMALSASLAVLAGREQWAGPAPELKGKPCSALRLGRMPKPELSPNSRHKEVAPALKSYRLNRRACSCFCVAQFVFLIAWQPLILLVPMGVLVAPPLRLYKAGPGYTGYRTHKKAERSCAGDMCQDPLLNSGSQNLNPFSPLEFNKAHIVPWYTVPKCSQTKLWHHKNKEGTQVPQPMRLQSGFH